MGMSADCQNTQSEHGRNATPLALIDAVHSVFGGFRNHDDPGIELDPSSDEVINEEVCAFRFYNLIADGYQQSWLSHALWLNPPGSSLSGGTYKDRLYWSYQLSRSKDKRGVCPSVDEADIKASDLIIDQWLKYEGGCPPNVKPIYAADWYRKLWRGWEKGEIGNAIALVYRAGSLGSVGYEMLSSAQICLTCAGAKSEAVNGSGRLSFETIEDGERTPQCSNTQSSVIIGLFRDPEMERKFQNEMSRFGVIKV